MVPMMSVDFFVGVVGFLEEIGHLVQVLTDNGVGKGGHGHFDAQTVQELVHPTLAVVVQEGVLCVAVHSSHDGHHPVDGERVTTEGDLVRLSSVEVPRSPPGQHPGEHACLRIRVSFAHCHIAVWVHEDNGPVLDAHNPGSHRLEPGAFTLLDLGAVDEDVAVVL